MVQYLITIGLRMVLQRIYLIKILAMLGPILGMVWGVVEQEMDVRTGSMVLGPALKVVR